MCASGISSEWDENAREGGRSVRMCGVWQPVREGGVGDSEKYRNEGARSQRDGMEWDGQVRMCDRV